MNIFDFAMQMEVDGEKYYRKLAEQTSVGGLRQVFIMLAEDEVKHYKVIERLKEEEPTSSELSETRIIDKVKNVFLDMKEEKPEMHSGETEQTHAYRKARDIEETSQRFYLEKAKEADGEHARELFVQLADEEAKHVRIIDEIVEFVSRPEPGEWLEDAEWTHLDEY